MDLKSAVKSFAWFRPFEAATGPKMRMKNFAK
jgi:hypothetical protein